MSKIEYILSLYTYSLPILWIDFAASLPVIFWLIFNWIVIPWIISLFVVFFVTEKITHRFLEKKYQINEKELDIRNKYIQKQEKIVQKEKEVLKEEEDNQRKRQSLEQEQEKNKYDEWNNDYEFLTNWFDRIYEDLSELIYENEGFTKVYKGWRWVHFDYRVTQILDSNNLIEETSKQPIDSNHVWKHYAITEKWKYFLKKYTTKIQ